MVGKVQEKCKEMIKKHDPNCSELDVIVETSTKVRIVEMELKNIKEALLKVVKQQDKANDTMQNFINSADTKYATKQELKDHVKEVRQDKKDNWHIVLKIIAIAQPIVLGYLAYVLSK